MILPISTIKLKFYQYQQLNVNSGFTNIQLNVNSDYQQCNQWFTIKCKQWFYQYQQLNVSSGSTNFNN